VRAQQAVPNQNDILKIVDQITSEKNVDVFVSNQPLPPNTAITTLYKPFVSPEYDSWFVSLINLIILITILTGKTYNPKKLFRIFFTKKLKPLSLFGHINRLI
jgi:hypothetical protein